MSIRAARPSALFIGALACLISAVCSAGAGQLDSNLQCVDLSDLDGDLPTNVVSSTQILVQDQDWEHSSYGNPSWPSGGGDSVGYPTVVKNVHGLNQDGKYYLYYAHHDPMSGIGCAVADSATGPYTKISPTDSKVLTVPNYNPGGPDPGDPSHYSSPSVVWNEEEQLWFMYFHYFNHYWGGAGDPPGEHWSENNPGLGQQMTALATTPDLSSHNWTIWTDPVWSRVSVWNIVPVLPTTDEAWMESQSSYHAIHQLPDGGWLAFMRGTAASGLPTVGFGTSTNGRDWSYFPENPVIAPGKTWTTNTSEYRPKFIGYLGAGEYLVAWAEHSNPHIIYSTTTNFTTFQRDSRGYATWGVGSDGITSAWREGDRLYLFSGKYVHEMVLTLVPDPDPEISNEGGATGVTHDAAWLSGDLISTGSSPTEVYAFWGTGDGGTEVSGWYTNEDLGTRGTGPFSENITGLDPNTVYYYRCYATNNDSMAWADPSEKFTTTGILPFEETFDTRSLGPLDWQNGWRASPSNAALVQTDLTYGGSARACSVSDGLVRHGFSDTAAASVVWLQLYCRPAAGEPPDMTNGSAVMYVDVTRYVGSYDGANNVLLTDKPAVAPDEWTWFVIRNDYSTKTWDLWMNGTNMLYGFDFRSADWDMFSGLKFIQDGVLTSYLDNVEISAARPTGIVLDRDADGMDDDWEEDYFTSTTNSSGGVDEDWDEDGFRDLYEYLAGTDPTNASSLLIISDAWVQPASNVVLKWLSVTDKFYSVFQSPELTAPWSLSASNLVGTPPLNIHTVNVDSSQEFFGIGLEQ